MAKKHSHLNKFILTFCGLFFLALCKNSMATQELDISLTAKSGLYSSADFRASTNPYSSLGIDEFDKEFWPEKTNRSKLYSVFLNGQTLVHDVWPADKNPRRLRLFYETQPRISGLLNMTWNFSSSDFTAVLKDYGNDSTRTSLNKSLNLQTYSNYLLYFEGIRYFTLSIENVPYFQEIDSSIPDECTQNKICTSWSVCQYLEFSKISGSVDTASYNEFKGECERSGWYNETCGFQTRECKSLSECSSFSFPKQSQACLFFENMSCLDEITNCHDGDCEINVDCGGPCKKCETCFDKKNNQAEEGVDCGGPCLKLCIVLTLKEKIQEYHILTYLYIILGFILLSALVAAVIKHIEYLRKKRGDSLKWYKL